ncbi:MAG: hypothetical protein C5B43_01835 [Verrucomicrobia bacterium]|nr:MAG: hypothetical protein C5B43_01835 [Verrucomicrobiota bacterium]
MANASYNWALVKYISLFQQIIFMKKLHTINNFTLSSLLFISALFYQGCSIDNDYIPVHQTTCIGDSINDSLLVTVEFFGNSTDMQSGAEYLLCQALNDFKYNPYLTLQIRGQSTFSVENDNIGLRRAETLVTYLLEKNIHPRDIKILSVKGRECLLLISKNTDWGMTVHTEEGNIVFKDSHTRSIKYICPNINETQFVSVQFWSDTTDMQHSGKSNLDDTIKKFKENPKFSFKIEGGSSFSEKEELGCDRAEIIRTYLIKAGISRCDIKILFSNGSKCLLLLGDKL